MPLAVDDVPSTIGAHGKRIWVYPRLVWGRFIRARTLTAWGLFLFLLLAPWVDVGGHPAIHFDIPSRRFHLLGLTLFATDAGYLLFALGIGLFAVFFFTALLGRVWCGWACPQTVFMESIIRPIERLIEGKETARRQLDRGPWTRTKIAKRALKLAVFAGVAGAIGTTFVAYFLGRDGVIEAQLDPFSHPAGFGFFFSISALLFFDFAWFREQVCVVVCPYGRWQSVLLDADSLNVGYDTRRGEPRGKVSKEGAGDCVDCKLCVQVCPTGIDIRKGVQMECVACTACIDACDSIMDKLDRPRGLIRYASENTLEGKPARILRPRVVVYGLAIVAIAVAASGTIALRDPIELRLIRQVGAPYVELTDGRVQNMTQLRISNKSAEPRVFSMRLVTPAGGDLVTPVAEVVVAAGEMQRVPVFVILADPQSPEGRSDFRIQVRDAQGGTWEIDYPFLSRPYAGG